MLYCISLEDQKNLSAKRPASAGGLFFLRRERTRAWCRDHERRSRPGNSRCDLRTLGVDLNKLACKRTQLLLEPSSEVNNKDYCIDHLD